MSKPNDALVQLSTWLQPALPLKLMCSGKQQKQIVLHTLEQQLAQLPQLQQQLEQAATEQRHSQTQLTQTRQQLLAAEQQLALLQQQLDQAHKGWQQTQTQLQQAEAQIPPLQQQLAEIEQRWQQSQQALTTVEQQLGETGLRQTLVARLLAASNSHAGVAEYFHLLHHDFVEFANQEDALPDEAAALLELQEIGNELKVVSAYPEFYHKRSLAIAGGFSAGKSEFISALFDDANIRLPSALEPTTAIPVYALNGQHNSVVACSLNGGTVDLLAIDPDFHHKLSHQFIRSFGFNLKSIMPFVFLTTPLPYQHLCFIDTPGYNPADTGGHTSEDVRTAEEFAHNADALLWLIGLDANGTIGQSDLAFLDRIGNHSQKPLYIVLNKADTRHSGDLEDILDVVADTLADYDIDVAGISAYSALMRQEYAYRGQRLADFLQTMDTPSNKHHAMLQRLYAVDEKYQRAILQEIKQQQQLTRTLGSLELDLLQAGFDDLAAEPYAKIGKLKALFSASQKEAHLRQLADITQQLAAAIDQVFGQTTQLQRTGLSLDDIELNPKFSQLTVPSSPPADLEEEDAAAADHDADQPPQTSPAKKPVQVEATQFWAYWKSRGKRFTPKQAKTLDRLMKHRHWVFNAEDWVDRPEPSSRRGSNFLFHTSPNQQQWQKSMKQLESLVQRGIILQEGSRYCFAPLE